MGYFKEQFNYSTHIYCTGRKVFFGTLALAWEVCVVLLPIIKFGHNSVCKAYTPDRDSLKLFESINVTNILLSITLPLQVDTILEFSSNQQTKYYALQVSSAPTTVHLQLRTYYCAPKLCTYNRATTSVHLQQLAYNYAPKTAQYCP